MHNVTPLVGCGVPQKVVPHREGGANNAAIPATCRWNIDFDAPVNLAEVH
jgi:hypothetical protein